MNRLAIVLITIFGLALCQSQNTNNHDNYTLTAQTERNENSITKLPFASCIPFDSTQERIFDEELNQAYSGGITEKKLLNICIKSFLSWAKSFSFYKDLKVHVVDLGINFVDEKEYKYVAKLPKDELEKPDVVYIEDERKTYIIDSNLKNNYEYITAVPFNRIKPYMNLNVSEILHNHECILDASIFSTMYLGTAYYVTIRALMPSDKDYNTLYYGGLNYMFDLFITMPKERMLDYIEDHAEEMVDENGFYFIEDIENMTKLKLVKIDYCTVDTIKLTENKMPSNVHELFQLVYDSKI